MSESLRRKLSFTRCSDACEYTGTRALIIMMCTYGVLWPVNIGWNSKRHRTVLSHLYERGKSHILAAVPCDLTYHLQEWLLVLLL